MAPGPPSWRALVAAALVALALVAARRRAGLGARRAVETDPAEGAVVETAPDDRHADLQRAGAPDLAGDRGLRRAGRRRSPRPPAPTATEVTVDLTGAADLADGTYVVSWNVLSGDGHPIAGALTFSVGAPSATVAAPPEPDDLVRGR